MTNPEGVTAQQQYEQALDRVGAYLGDCADLDNDESITACPQHPVTAGDLWMLYCAHRENGNTERDPMADVPEWEGDGPTTTRRRAFPEPATRPRGPGRRWASARQ